MELVSNYFTITLYLLGIVLLVVLIILGIKMIKILNKVDDVVEDVNDKVESLNGVFKLVEKTSDSLGAITTSIVTTFSTVVAKIINKKNNE